MHNQPFGDKPQRNPDHVPKHAKTAQWQNRKQSTTVPAVRNGNTETRQGRRVRGHGFMRAAAAAAARLGRSRLAKTRKTAAAVITSPARGVKRIAARYTRHALRPPLAPLTVPLLPATLPGQWPELDYYGPRLCARRSRPNLWLPIVLEDLAVAVADTTRIPVAAMA